jgi:hypothetical protein
MYVPVQQRVPTSIIINAAAATFVQKKLPLLVNSNSCVKKDTSVSEEHPEISKTKIDAQIHTSVPLEHLILPLVSIIAQGKQPRFQDLVQFEIVIFNM